MQFVILCFTDFVYYCMPIYVPSLNKGFIIILYYIIIIMPDDLAILENDLLNQDKHATCRPLSVPVTPHSSRMPDDLASLENDLLNQVHVPRIQPHLTGAICLGQVPTT